MIFERERWARSVAPLTPIGDAQSLLEQLDQPVFVLRREDGLVVSTSVESATPNEAGALRLVGADGPATLDQLAAPDFLADHDVRAPYVAGSMTQGIASPELVIAMAQDRLLSFFGAGGLSFDAVRDGIGRIQSAVGREAPWGVNLINNPMHPGYEDAVVDLLLEHHVRKIEASAYMTITPGLVRYRLAGASVIDGKLVAPNQIIAKVSREELAEQFFSPPPPKIVSALRDRGVVSAAVAERAAQLPLAQDVVAEADSAGHTDRRAALILYPTIATLRDQVSAQNRYDCRLRVGAAGGICTPRTVRAAFFLGADFVLTGSVNQACIESGMSAYVKARLADATVSDVAMAPAADMFEMGVQVQVLTRGLMFHTKARRLEDLYSRHGALDDLSQKDRTFLEKRVFKRSLEDVWSETQAYFARVDARVLEKAERDPRVKMALVFRWYLGMSSKWPRAPDLDRKVDFQVWCGPSMGAFNRWVRGTPLARPENRRVVTVANALLTGALYLDRVAALSRQGVDVPASLRAARPQSTSSS